MPRAMVLLLACILIPSSVLGFRDRKTDPYPWLAADDLDVLLADDLDVLQRRVGIGNFTLDVESFLGAGKFGNAFRVTIAESGLAEMRGLPAVLKIEKEEKPVGFQPGQGTLRYESDMLDQAATVRHAVRKLHFGKLWVPGATAGSRMDIQSEALLETMASGSTLEALRPEMMSRMRLDVFRQRHEGYCDIVIKCMKEFACDMERVGLRHDDLHAENVLVQPSHGENAVTVIDFGFAQKAWGALQETRSFLWDLGCPQEPWTCPPEVRGAHPRQAV